MSAGRDALVAAVFDAAVALPEEGRAAFVAARCGGDEAAARAVRQLLDADRGAGRFMARPTIDPGEAGGAAPAFEPGDRVGGYRVLGRLGEGGYGAVFKAEQEAPVRRQVALKVMKAGADGAAAAARFEFEKQALAQMEHPGIATVFDAGTTPDGMPFVAMELVEGETITAFCGNRRLGRTERLRLFAEVCAAVAHAHNKGVIHRDLKPANVLVGQRDGAPRPVVIDFGIGAAPDQPAAGGGRYSGTPGYSPPEQSDGGADARGDVFSLGVLLHELLTGELPREGGEAPPAELASVVSKATEREPEGRYGGAGELAAEVARYLGGRPVEAHHGGPGYRFAKFVGRHRFGVAAAGAGGVALLAALALSVFGLLRAQQEAELARTEAARARAFSDLLDEMLSSADPALAKGPDFRLAQLLDEFDAGLGTQLAAQPEIEAPLRATLGRAYLSLGDGEKALRHSRRAAELAGEGKPGWAAARRGEGRALDLLGRRSEAVAVLRSGLEVEQPEAGRLQCEAALIDALRKHGGLEEAASRAAALAGSEALGALPASDAAGVLNVLAETLHAAGDTAAAEALARRCEGIVAAQFGDRNPRALRANVLLAKIAAGRGDTAEARRRFAEAAELARERLGPDHPLTATLAKAEAESLLAAGDAPASEAKFYQSAATLVAKFGAAHPDALASMSGIARALVSQDRAGDASDYVRDQTGVDLAAYLRGEPVRLADLAAPLREIAEHGRHADFVPLADALHAAAVEHLGAGHEVALGMMRLRGYLAAETGDTAAAEALQREAVAGYRERFGDDHPLVDDCLWWLGELYRDTGQMARAAGLEERFPDGAPRGRAGRTGYLCTAAGRWREAGFYGDARDALERARAAAGDDVVLTTTVLLEWGKLHRRLGADTLAIDALETARDLAPAAGDLAVRIDRELAEALIDRMHFGEARELIGTRFPDLAERSRQRRAEHEAALRAVPADSDDLDFRWRQMNHRVRLGRFAEALALIDDNESAARRQFGEGTKEHLWAATMRGWVANFAGDTALADRELARALEFGLRELGPRHGFTASTIMNHAVHLRSRGRLDELVARIGEHADRVAGTTWPGEIPLVPRAAVWEWQRGEHPLPVLAPVGQRAADLNTDLSGHVDEGRGIALRHRFDVATGAGPSRAKLHLRYRGRCSIELNGEPLALPERGWEGDDLDTLYPVVVTFDAALLRPGENLIEAQIAATGGGWCFFDLALSAAP